MRGAKVKKEQILMQSQTDRISPVHFILFPAIAMLLGWGLRGYIGGGPFAAMIPGVFVALGFSLVFGHDVRTAAIVAMFGALGVGYGGDMTYGQTLGLAKEIDTRAWGFLGVTIKGGVWGLLGGAVLGAGFARQVFSKKTLSIAFLITIVAFYIGWKLINEPKLIYFSDPVNKPREESWAGLLFAAIAFLGYLRAKSDGPGSELPMRFALWGALGGALGFGIGTAWLVYGPALPVNQKWWGWWKMMEFTFGLLLGAGLGIAAWRNREQCAKTTAGDSPERGAWWPVVAVVIFMATMFLFFGFVMEGLAEGTYSPLVKYALTDTFRVIGSFIFLGAVCFWVGLRSVSAAWQIAITLTFFHTVFDLVQDFTGETPGSGFRFPNWALIIALFGWTAAMGAVAARVASGERVVARMYLLILWACYAVATARTFVQKEVLFPGDGPGFFTYFIVDNPATFVMHMIFTVSAIITTVYIVKLRQFAPMPAQ